MGHTDIHQPFGWLWKCFCQPKHKVFFWLLLQDRLSTRDILRRKRMQLDSYKCVLCNDSIVETSTHLFLDCPFAKDCRNSIGIAFQGNISAADAMMQIRSQSSNWFFMMFAILMSWVIWTVRSDQIFKNLQPEVDRAKEVFRKEIQLLSLRARAKDSNLFDQWIQNLL